VYVSFGGDFGGLAELQPREMGATVVRLWQVLGRQEDVDVL